MSGKSDDLREVLKDAHAFFFLLKGEEVERLRMWDILPDSIVIDVPLDSPLRKVILGYIPTLMGNAIYEIEGNISDEQLPDQMEDTLRVIVDPKNAKKVNRRLFPRYSFAPPLDAKIIPENDEEIAAGIINLSAGGLRVEVPSQLKPDMEYTFEFDVNLDDEIHSLSLAGSIIYEIPLDAGFSYGVRFGIADEEAASPTDEVPVDVLDKTVDIMNLVNKLIVRGKKG